MWTGHTSTRRRSGGITPRLRDALQRIKSGFLSSFLQVFKREAGTPSAPAAEELLSSEHAISISNLLKSMSASLGPPCPELKNYLALSKTNSGLGWTKTDLYWSDKTWAVKSGSGFGILVIGSRNGPIFALVFCLDFVKL